VKIELLPLSGTPLVESWLRGEEKALAYFGGNPRELESYRRKAVEVGARFTREDRHAIASALTGGGADREERLRAFAEEGGCMVTTGQQPGLFGGPLYCLYKGLTASVLAARLQSELGCPVLPLFWVASEDHDWEEVRGVHAFDQENRLHKVSLPPLGGSAHSIHRIRLDSSIASAIEEFLGYHPASDFSERWRSLIHEGYPAGGTLSAGFGRIMEELLAPAGVFVVQAHDKLLKERSKPLLLRELRESREREAVLRTGAESLLRDGFSLQVPLLEGATNLLFEGGAGRERLFIEGDGFRLRGSERRITLAEIEASVEEDSSLLSPNVLLRPVVESALLPTLSYVGGGAEVAYWGQNIPLFRAVGIAPPIVHPRASFVLVEKKIDKVLKKFGLETEEMARPPHELLAEVLRDALPAEAAGTLHNLRAAIQFGFEEVRSEAGKIDPTLRGAIDSPMKRSLDLIDEVEKKLLQSVRRAEELSLDQVAKAQAHLYPEGVRQERMLNPFYYLMRYGDDFLRELHERTREAVLP